MSQPNDAPMKHLILPSLAVVALVVVALAVGVTDPAQLLFFSLVSVFVAVFIQGLAAGRVGQKARE